LYVQYLDSFLECECFVSGIFFRGCRGNSLISKPSRKEAGKDTETGEMDSRDPEPGIETTKGG